MRATGIAADVLEACEKAKQEFAKTYAELAPRTEKARQNYISKKSKWDLFRRSPEYWAIRWNDSESRALILQCNGTSWTRQREEIVLTVEQQVKRLESFDTFTLSAFEIEAICYIHA
jgi:hypothetical protein